MRRGRPWYSPRPAKELCPGCSARPYCPKCARSSRVRAPASLGRLNRGGDHALLLFVERREIHSSKARLWGIKVHNSKRQPAEQQREQQRYEPASQISVSESEAERKRADRGHKQDY